MSAENTHTSQCASGSPLIRAKGLAKRFKLYERPRDRLFEWISGGALTKHTEFWALKNIDIDIHPGECLGVIGRNGSGKSTLLKLLSGALIPTRGNVRVNGRVYALLELGTGFNKQLTGRQNITHAGAMLGIPNAYIKEREQQIIEFADLGAFIDVPVRSYSSGMMSRLAFSLFAFLDPDVLMIDEVLSVGDEAFKARCFELIEQRVREGRAVVYVSHALRTMVRLCDRVVWVEQGEIVDIGDPTEIINAFVQKHRTSGPGRARDAGSEAADPQVSDSRPKRVSQPDAPVSDVIVPEIMEASSESDPEDGACVYVDNRPMPTMGTQDNDSKTFRIERLWIESPLGDHRTHAPAGLSFVLAAQIRAQTDDPQVLEIEIDAPDGTVIGGVRTRLEITGSSPKVLRLLCSAGLGPGTHAVRARTVALGGVSERAPMPLLAAGGADLPVIGTAPSGDGIVLFRKLTLRDSAGGTVRETRDEDV